ncbi:tetratricopeptide (TPR) repeat protein [Kitasatospora gansuensis]|uniref:Tetratricopeptide (TPR) repeat protein n=1 Tax=Kitasatospora gansuensis TaxID=258050 RepID=A0A7W7SFM6_9ACTN|nr:hypothetical protein [Kitasatospora gansuensis]MBB4949502.1 tetratricopeptide (TPR) repeat protein [Kitasatospora gansuensis]
MSSFSAPRDLPEDLATVLAVVAGLPFAVLEPGLVAAALGTRPDAVADVLPRLAALRLLRAHPAVEGLWVFPEGRRVSPLPARRTDPAEQLDQLQRAVAWWLAAMVAAERHLAPWHRLLEAEAGEEPSVVEPLAFAGREQARAWVSGQRDSVVAVIAAGALRWDYLTWRGTLAASRTLWRHLPEPGVQLLCTNWAVPAVQGNGDRQQVRAVLLARSDANRQASRYSDACDAADAALYSAEEDGDEQDRGQALHAGAAALLAATRTGPATERAVKALAVRERTGDERAAALTRLLLGLCHQQGGDRWRALAELDAARAVLARVGDEFDHARALAHLARARAVLNDDAGALADFEQAAGLFAAVGADPWRGRCLTWWATTLPKERWDESYGMFTEALELFGDAFHPERGTATAALVAYGKRRPRP